MEEWLDVINEKEEVIGKALRSECHEKRLLHRSVIIFVFNSKGQIFIQKRSSKKDVYPGYYEGSLSGHVLSRETYEQTAKRELKEELGIKEEPKKSLNFSIFTEKEATLSALFVLESYDGPIKISSKEVVSGGFVSIDKLQKEISKKKKKFMPGFIKAFEIYLSQK